MSDETKNETEETKVDAPAEQAPETTENLEEKETESTLPEVEEGAEAVELKNRDIKPGMVVRVHERIIDVNSKGEERQRTQVFEGMVMGIKGPGVSRTVTVRKNSKGWMVEKIYPLNSPNVEKIEVVKQYSVKRGKLSYLRGRFRRKLKEVSSK